MKTLIIVPAYNEELNIPSLAKRLEEIGRDYLIINDGSRDSTKEMLDEMNLCHLDLPINVGLAKVTQIGFKYAVDYGYDQAIVIDGDGQHPPEYIALLLDKLAQGYDYVIGSRFIEKKKPWTLRMIGSRFISMLIYIKTGKVIVDPTSGMRALGKRVLQQFSEEMNFIAEPDALVSLLKNKMEICEVQVDMVDRNEGVSYFASPLKSMKYMIEVFISIIFLQ